MTYRHIMLDLETWGTCAGCAIRSIGAVLFDFDGKPLGASYYANIDDESCRALGFTFEPVVIAWWGEQSAEAQAALLDNPLPITTALEGFARFIEANDEPEVCLWSHGASFDIPVTDFAIRAAGLRPPWKYSNSRDTRTLIWLAGQLGITVDLPHIGLPHHALDDAKTQALRMIELRQRIAPYEQQPDQHALSS